MTIRTKLLSLGAGLFATVAVAGATTAPANANIFIHIGPDGFHMGRHAVCHDRGPRVGPHAVRRELRMAGFHRVQDVTYIPRRVGRACGFYQSTAFRHGRTYHVYSSARTGEVIQSRPVRHGRVGPDRGPDRGPGRGPDRGGGRF